MSITQSERDSLMKLVVGMFAAAPGATYFDAIVSLYEASGKNLGATAQTLGGTSAYAQVHPTGATANDFAADFLSNLGLQNNAMAVAFVVDRLNAGVPKWQIQVEGLNALEATSLPEFASAKAILVNKTDVATYYTMTARVTTTDLDSLKAAVTHVTDQDASVTAAKANIDSPPAVVTPPVVTPPVEMPPATTFVVSETLGAVLFGGTATGDVTAMISGLDVTFSRANVEAATKLTVLDIASFPAGATVKLGADTTLSVAQATHLWSVTGFDGNGKNVSLLDTADHLLASTFVGAIANVTVSDAASLADLTTIGARTHGAVTAKGGIVDTIGHLLADHAYIHGSVDVTVTDQASIADLTALSLMTSGTIATSGGIADTAAHLEAGGAFVAPSEVVLTVTDTVGYDDVAALLQDTGGVLWLTNISDTAANIDKFEGVMFTGDNGDYSARLAWPFHDQYGDKALPASITWTDYVGVGALNFFSNMSAGTMSYTLVKDIYGAINFAVWTDMVTGTPTLEFTDPCSLYVADAVSSKLPLSTLLFDAGFGDTVANLLADTTWIKGGAAVTVTEPASFSDLAIVAAKFGSATPTTIADSLANLTADTTYLKGSVNAYVTDSSMTLADFDTLQLKTSGAVGGNQLQDTAAHIAAGLAGGDMLGAMAAIVHTHAELAHSEGTNGVADTFQVASDAASISIAKFEHGTDQIDLKGFVDGANVVWGAIAVDGKVDINVTDTGSDTVITLDSGAGHPDGTLTTTITLTGVHGVAIGVSDFILA